MISETLLARKVMPDITAYIYSFVEARDISIYEEEVSPKDKH